MTRTARTEVCAVTGEPQKGRSRERAPIRRKSGHVTQEERSRDQVCMCGQDVIVTCSPFMCHVTSPVFLSLHGSMNYSGYVEHYVCITFFLSKHLPEVPPPPDIPSQGGKARHGARAGGRSVDRTANPGHRKSCSIQFEIPSNHIYDTTWGRP